MVGKVWKVGERERRAAQRGRQGLLSHAVRATLRKRIFNFFLYFTLLYFTLFPGSEMAVIVNG